MIPLRSTLHDGPTTVRRRFEREDIFVAPPDALDLESATEFTTQLHTIPNDTNVIIDLRRLDFCDSSGLGALVVAADRLADGGGSMVLSAPSERFLRLLDTTGLRGQFTIHPTRRRRAP